MHYIVLHYGTVGLIGWLQYETAEIGKAKQAYVPLAPVKSYGPFLKSMGHDSNGMGQKFKKRNIGILVREVTFVSVYHTASCS